MARPPSRLSIAFELYELAEDLVRAKVLRRDPDASREEVERAVAEWRTKGEMSLADHPDFHVTWRDLS